MADSQAASNSSNEKVCRIDWALSDDEVIAQMNGLIEALKNKTLESITTLLRYEGGCGASTHIFGEDGKHFCKPEVVSTWLSLLVTLASLEEITGESIASLFPKSCGGCMVYSILMAVGCFHSDKNIQLAFDFFRHVLADPSGEILELEEVDKLSSLLAQSIPPRSDGTFMRAVCLELSSYEHNWNRKNKTGDVKAPLRLLIEGLGVLCTSKSFLNQMKTDAIGTRKILKESIMKNEFSYEFAKRKWD